MKLLLAGCRNGGAERRPDQRRALELLAACPDGCTESILRTHGFTIEQMAALVRAGLATGDDRVRRH